MAHVDVHAEFDLDSPTLVEGLPGAGLVGKIAADHLVEQFEMTHVASCFCEGLPPVAVYRGNSSETMPPVRIYADEERNLLVLQSDVPVSPSQADEFAGCLTGWFADNDVFPLYLSGLPEEKDGVPEVYGIATGGATDRLDEAGVVPPRESGLVSGPTGALIHEANVSGLASVGLIAETEAQFPDPEAARAVISNGIEPLAGIEVETDALVDQAEKIQEARERLARQVQEAEGDESTEARPIRGFQ
ncbi:proteasome assembly chaperone family protein [Halorarius halobius]|uniref:proteasome assembly chaperone family protein n=1 Tax=Halorarius halobius TaxID=2962671 RepID=UPI0020CBDAA4|nr:PAC2 family protein [Halorarius halobius]